MNREGFKRYIVEWYSQENQLARCSVFAASWRDALFRVCNYLEWLHDVDVVGLRVRSVYSRKWHYPKPIDDPVKDN